MFGTYRMCEQRIPKKEGIEMKAQANFFRASSYSLSKMRAANDLARLHLSALKPEFADTKFYRLVQERLVLIAYANLESLKRWM